MKNEIHKEMRYHRPKPKGMKRKPDPAKQTRKAYARQLVQQYGMHETTALQIAAGSLSLTVWLEKQARKKANEQRRQAFNAKVAALAQAEAISPRIAALILKGIFSLEEYREKKNAKEQREKLVRAFAQKHDIAVPIARMILKGKFTLEEYQQRLALKQERKRKALAIHRANPDIALGTCHQIVDENISVEEFRKRRERNRRRRGSWYRQYLKDHKRENRPLGVYLDKLKLAKKMVTFAPFLEAPYQAIVLGFTPYTLKIQSPAGEIKVVPKLTLKYLTPSEDFAAVQQTLQYDQHLRKSPLLPPAKPSQRYHFPPGLPAKGQILRLYLRSGEIITGYVEWSSKFDINLRCGDQKGPSVILFRHAVIKAYRI